MLKTHRVYVKILLFYSITLWTYITCSYHFILILPSSALLVSQYHHFFWPEACFSSSLTMDHNSCISTDAIVALLLPSNVNQFEESWHGIDGLTSRAVIKDKFQLCPGIGNVLLCTDRKNMCLKSQPRKLFNPHSSYFSHNLHLLLSMKEWIYL